MSTDFLKTNTDYDIVIIGSGLAGMTAANRLAKNEHSVLLLEHHSKLGGLATWFKRRGKHIFDISLHGFPVGMIKTCRKYWSSQIAQSIIQLKCIRFDNPQFSFSTTFDTQDFTNILYRHFHIQQETVDAFFQAVRKMDFYDDQSMTTRELFEKFFPGRDDVMSLLMEPITYANGSDLDDPAITYGIVFSNFMNKGVFTFQGGTDHLINQVQKELENNGAHIKVNSLVEKILINDRKIYGLMVNGKTIRCKAILSNANLLTTIHDLVGNQHFSQNFIEDVNKVRVNNSSCQVYIGIRQGEHIDYVGDLLFTSDAENFDPIELRSKNTTSRTFSFYYPSIRPGSNQYTIVASTNANYDDWIGLSTEEYQASKTELIDSTLVSLEKYVPDIRQKIDYLEASTPLTFKKYTRHVKGSSFGTKFEGLKVSMGLHKQISGLFHAGSVGIIMSGWLGAANYGAIAANEIDKYMAK